MEAGKRYAHSQCYSKRNLLIDVIQRPTSLSYSSQKARNIAETLLCHPAVRRIAGFGNGTPPSLGNRSPRSCKRPAALQLFAPRLYKFYSSTLDSVCANDPDLKRNFEKSVFAAMTINLGPQTVTRKHVDHFNIPFGWCVITALGDFDHTRGGHLVLWELKLIIEFPAGSTVFIPSATINHSNIAVQPHERRYSITQYTAGGLARWVACGFKTLKSLAVDGETLAMCGTERWREGVGLLATWGELRRAFGLD